MADRNVRKVYSPDIAPLNAEGKGLLLGTIASVVVAPIRLVSRVMHNIMVMPANLQSEYAAGLLVVASLTTLLGLVDLIVYHKWVLLVSQLPLFPVAYKIRKMAITAADAVKEERVVDIDTEQVEAIFDNIYDELDNIVKE